MAESPYQCSCVADKQVFNHVVSSPPPTGCGTDQLLHTRSLLIRMQAYLSMREVEQASFTPLDLSAAGSMTNEANVFYKRLALCLAIKINGTDQLDI